MKKTTHRTPQTAPTAEAIGRGIRTSVSNALLKKLDELKNIKDNKHAPDSFAVSRTKNGYITIPAGGTIMDATVSGDMGEFLVSLIQCLHPEIQAGTVTVTFSAETSEEVEPKE